MFRAGHCSYCGGPGVPGAPHHCGHCPTLYCSPRCVHLDRADHIKVCPRTRAASKAPVSSVPTYPPGPVTRPGHQLGSRGPSGGGGGGHQHQPPPQPRPAEAFHMGYGRPRDGGQQENSNFNGFGDFHGSREDLRYMEPMSRGDQGAGEANNYSYRPSFSHGPGINPPHPNPRYQGRHDPISGRDYGLPVQEKGDGGFDPFKKPHLYQSTASYDGRTRVFENSTLKSGGSYSKGQTQDVRKNFVSQSAYQNMNQGFQTTQGRPPLSFPGKPPSCAPQYDNKNKQDNKVESKVKVDQKGNGQTTNSKPAQQQQQSKLDPKVKLQQNGKNIQDASRKKIHANLYQVLKPDSSIDETDVSDQEADDSAAEKRKVAPPPKDVKKPSASASNTTKPPPSQVSKDEKKKQKKENQKARARETEKNKLKEYLLAAENEVTKKKFSSALSLIFKALNCNPSADDSLRLYQVRIKIYLSQNKHELVLNDAKKVLEIDSSNVECLKHISSSCLKSGDVEEWNLFYQRFKGSSKIVDEAQKNMSRLEKLASDAMNMESEKKYSEAVGAIEQCLKISPNSEKFLCWKARLYSMLKDFDMADKAFAKLDQVIQGIKSCQTSLAKGIYFFYLWKPDAAYNHLLEAQKELKEADEWFKRIREMRNMYNKIKQACDTGMGYVHAIRLAKEGLEMAPDNDEFMFALHMRRANLNDRYAFDKEEAIADINRAIGIKNRDSYCYFMRGTLNLDLDNLEAAVEDLKQAINISRKTEYIRKLKEAEVKIKKRDEKKRRDSERAAFSAAAAGNTHYDILGVARTASSQQIRAAYKEKAKAFHPDKHGNATKEHQSEMEAKMKDVARAYSCLSNAQTRESYDWKLDHDDSDWSSDDGFCHCGDDDIFMDLGDLLFFFSMFGDSGSRSRRRSSRGFRRRR